MMDMDHRAGFLFSRVDGVMDVEQLQEVSGMPRFDALRILSLLLREGIVRRD
jgi:DNA-binding IclR family transcriptional regulator